MFLTVSQWALLVGALMPMLVGIITKANASANVKAITLLVLDAVGGVLTEYFATPGGFDWRNAVVSALAALITSVATYYGFLKHTNNLGLNTATARFGFGTQRDHDRAA
jgi:cellobiose-specific phosphotransferase system component IIC